MPHTTPPPLQNFPFFDPFWHRVNCHFVKMKDSLNHNSIELQTIFKTKNLCSQRSCDHIQWFQWLQVVIQLTLVWRHMHWSRQKHLEVMIISINVKHHFNVRPLYNILELRYQLHIHTEFYEPISMILEWLLWLKIYSKGCLLKKKLPRRWHGNIQEGGGEKIPFLDPKDLKNQLCPSLHHSESFLKRDSLSTPQ